MEGKDLWVLISSLSWLSNSACSDRHQPWSVMDSNKSSGQGFDRDGETDLDSSA
jgi:hypothetical protein